MVEDPELHVTVMLDPTLPPHAYEALAQVDLEDVDGVLQVPSRAGERIVNEPKINSLTSDNWNR